MKIIHKAGMGLFVLGLAGLLSVASALGQATASLRGTISDRSGAVVPNAKITLVNTATDVRRTTSSDATGPYEILKLVPGTYRLEVEAEGFRKYSQAGIVLLVNQDAQQDVQLEVGAKTEIIEVTENVALVDTVTAQLGKVESERRILDLPLVGRDTLQLGLLQAGVFAPDPDDGSLNPFSVAGQRSESLTFLVDGADNNDFLGNNIVISPNPDAVQEFKILTNNYDAEYGRTSGGIVNQVIKSGSNGLHGGLFEFLRNDALNSRDFFSIDRGSFKRNVFGGSVGGPIKKDKSFFFANYQGTRRREGEIAPVLTVLSPAERTGDFSALLPSAQNPNGVQLVNPVTGQNYVNNQVPVNPIIANYISKYLPLPNLPNNEFISGPTKRVRDDQAVFRVDHNFSERNTLSGVYLFEDTPDLLPFFINKGASTGGNVPVGSAFTDAKRFQTASITWTHTFSPTVLNESRFAGNRNATLQASPVDHTTPQALGFTNVNPDDFVGAAPPILFTNSFNLGPSPQGPTTLHDATFQWQDTLSVIKGRHTMKFGADIRRVRLNFNFDFYNNGSFDFTYGNFTGNEVADFVAGFPDNYYQTAHAVYGIRSTSWHYYGQDSWKVTPRFTMNLGLRYEYNSPQVDLHNNVLGYFPGHQSTIFPDAPPGILYPYDSGTPNRGLVYPDRNNFAPRFGFAWDVKGNSKLVVRGGGGVFYDIEDGGLNLQFGGQPPFGDISNLTPASLGGSCISLGVADPFGTCGITNPFPFATQGRVGQFLTPKIGFAYVTDPRFRTPYSENYNFGLQYQLTPNTLLETVYVGSLGRKLISTADVNFANPGDEMRQFNAYGIVNIDCARPLSGCFGTTNPGGDSLTNVGELLTNLSNGISDSHELQVTLEKRMSHGFDMRGAYTFGKTIDLTSGFRSRSSTFTDPVNYRLDRALADFDATHRLVLSGIWELPISGPFQGKRILKGLTEGWQGNGIVTFQSGNPITLYSNNDSGLQNDGPPNLERPDQLGPVPIFRNPRKARQFTPTSASRGSCFAATDANGTTTTGNFYIDPSNLDCATVPMFTFGTLGRNAFRGPGINNWDLSLVKKTNITERQSIEFRAEFFNTWNHTQFSNPDNTGGSGTFGQITTVRGHDSDTTSGARIIQFGLKYYF